ncbi:hypothetical protein QBC35DRAFT_525942 [Podospora australis]|uniref:Amine oxidase domain-containing protein n=1 Tax=Podospora australis TaxID=1536484 RepID=A0AAN6WNW2_9PEZI|nr:hypothetical protein QBC35DRAFT_525942 [Podospora australis]
MKNTSATSSGPNHQQPQPQQRVAIIGTGLAGLTTAHLLHNDPKNRYAVTLLEQAESLSFDSASVAVKNHQTGATERIDLPMRASAGGYYANLNRMYRYLQIPMHPVRFLFVFAKALNHAEQPPASSSTTVSALASAVPGGYFIHTSNHHRLLPPRPSSYSLWRYLLEVFFLIICHTWFTAACFLVKPEDESLAQYLGRIWLPRRYITHYILPLMSGVSTCTHAQLLEFPASDVINYVKLSYNQHHYTVCGGVQQVQSRLTYGIKDIRVRSRVLEVKLRTDNNTIVVRWQNTVDNKISEEVFERVVLAVSPDVASRILSPLRAVGLEMIPTAWVESSILTPSISSVPHYSLVNTEESEEKRVEMACMHHRVATAEQSAASTQVITLRSQLSAGTGAARTEALHVMPSGVVVSTCPLDASGSDMMKRRLKTAGFTRTLRTVESRAIVESVMGRAGSKGGWVNGEDNIWLAGAWCWDGMVLLEGCVVSAMKVAEDFVAIVIITLFLLSSTGGLYDLDHWKLNLRMPVPSMWMNMGYWEPSDKNTAKRFDEACSSLLQEVLTTAGLLGSAPSISSPSELAIFDLGIGCGDQTQHLIRLFGAKSLRYVGLTLNRTQLETAVRRLPEVKGTGTGYKNASIGLFCADAAKPSTWSAELNSAVQVLSDEKFAAGPNERWLLALDCLYHFSPSRQPIMSYASRRLRANFAAFDLTLNKSATPAGVLLAKILGVLMGCPWKAFLKEDEYRDQLVASGYSRDSVIVRDISEHVFPGLVEYLNSQDKALAEHGISLGPGFRLAGGVFGWFASAKAIRAVIIVAHTDDKKVM